MQTGLLKWLKRKQISRNPLLRAPLNPVNLRRVSRVIHTRYSGASGWYLRSGDFLEGSEVFKQAVGNMLNHRCPFRIYHRLGAGEQLAKHINCDFLS